MKTVTLKGVLVDGIFGIGGEHTGWELQTDKPSSTEVDVVRVEALADRFRNKFVEITGYYTTRGYLERGPIEVLMAEEMLLLPGRKK